MQVTECHSYECILAFYLDKALIQVISLTAGRAVLILHSQPHNMHVSICYETGNWNLRFQQPTD